jgi:cytochrome P450
MRNVRADSGKTSSSPPGTAMSACPVVYGKPFDPLDPEQVVDPFPWLSQAQREAPVFYVEDFDFWCVTRYDDVLEVLKDPSTYSSEGVVRVEYSPEVSAEHPEGHPISNGMLNIDPPRHTRLRQLALKAFTPRMIASREDDIRGICNSLIDEFVADGHCDIVTQFSRHLPIRVIAMIIGVPPERIHDLDQWHEDSTRMSNNSPGLSPEEHRRLSESAVRFGAWFTEFVDERRANPQNDLATALVAAKLEDGTAELTTAEIIGQIGIILSAGTGTTVNFIPILIRDLLRNPEQWKAVKADRSLIPRAVEEALRLHTPIRGLCRRVTSDTLLGGVQLVAGSRVYIHYGSAQRDARVFTEPETFDIFRNDVDKHFAFGRGTHFCLGAPLARLETRVVLDCIIDRLPNVRLAPGREEHWRPSILLPRLDAMQLEWDRPSRPGPA